MSSSPSPPEPVPHPEVLTILKEKFPHEVVETIVNLGDWEATVKKEAIPEMMLFLRDDKRTDFKMLMDLSAVDGLTLGLPSRFYVVYHLYSLTKKHRLRVKAFVPANDSPVP